MTQKEVAYLLQCHHVGLTLFWTDLTLKLTRKVSRIGFNPDAVGPVAFLEPPEREEYVVLESHPFASFEVYGPRLPYADVRPKASRGSTTARFPSIEEETWR